LPPEKTDQGEASHIGSGALTIIRDRFVFDPETGQFFLASVEGTWILRAIQSGLSEQDIEAGLIERYGINPGTAMRDLEQFKLRLVRLGLIPKSLEK